MEGHGGPGGPGRVMAGLLRLRSLPSVRELGGESRHPPAGRASVLAAGLPSRQPRKRDRNERARAQRVWRQKRRARAFQAKAGEARAALKAAGRAQRDLARTCLDGIIVFHNGPEERRAPVSQAPSVVAPCTPTDQGLESRGPGAVMG